ncbi:hypothetical protein SAMN05519104_2982 [Rhizobiales bacterium GAS188]|nr:hypothetical protein SAMN05519104_2982 [Rhizobiales bacterium GAS188]
MAGVNRGPLLRADFADVLDTVGRGAALRLEDEEPGLGPAAGNSAAASSFDFLQALDSIAEPQTQASREVGNAFANFYADLAIEALVEEPSLEPPPPYVAEPETRPTQTASQSSDQSCDQSCDPMALVAELGLRPGLKPTELKRIRRAFALDNHPDRLDPSRRELASRRMTLANSLIDEALRRTKARG